MLTDKEIRDKLCEINIDEKVIPNYKENNYYAGYLEGFERAAKWARDKACEWVPVSRELPKHERFGLSEKVLTLDENGSIDTKKYDSEQGEFIPWEIKKPAITHWQPLPDKPKSE